MSIQFRSDDETLTEDHVLSIWSKTFIEAGEKLGKTFRIAELAAGYMRDAGFQNVVEHRYKLPVGPWSRDKKLKSLGIWNLVHCEHGIEGWAMALLTRVMKVRDEISILIDVYLISSRRDQAGAICVLETIWDDRR